ncbi:MAG: rhomboid family intramembrane serine protease [Acidobacteriota bacterium]|nr:rhomboid family intramembrane serine protease [Acidobacteriota bacterium]
MSLLAVLLVPGLILYFMTPEERLRLWHRSEALARRTRATVGATRSAGDPFYAALEAQRRWPVVTCALAAANVGVMIAMLLGPDALGNPDTLVAWGGNFGPQTTGTERWRVFTSVFAHRGVVHLLVNIAVLVQLGLLLERIAGPFTFGTVYVASGVLGSVMSTVAAPMSVFVGSSGAVCGLYGLLLIVLFRGAVQSTAVRVPLSVITTLAPTAIIFSLYYWASGDSWLTAKVGLWTGIVSGVVLTRSVPDERVRLRRFAALGTATAGIVMMSAMGLRAITDVRPAIAELITAEERASSDYNAAVRQFTRGTINRQALTRMIDATILPQVQQSSARFADFVNVPARHTALVRDAQHYLRLRHESWRSRSEALRKANMQHLREADDRERAALHAFVRLRTAAAAQ